MTESTLTEPYPVVQDTAGYVLTDRDFRFLGIEVAAAHRCAAGTAPLGLTAAQYTSFTDTLEVALTEAGLDDADVRLQGSSVRFFSSPAKPFPRGKTDLAELYIDEHDAVWSEVDGNAIHAAYTAQWPTTRPSQRPYDSMYRLGVIEDPSDIDVQISSAAAYGAAERFIRGRGINPKELRMRSTRYSFIRKEIVRRLFLPVTGWATHWEAVTGRQVNLAYFGAGGPDESSHVASSHFKDTDWIVRRKR